VYKNAQEANEDAKSFTINIKFKKYLNFNQQMEASVILFLWATNTCA
jgi:hypothetical protein